MGRRQLLTILLAPLVVTFAIIQQCYCDPNRASSWLWPDQVNGTGTDVNKTRNILSSKSRGTGTADPRTHPRAFLKFGGISNLSVYIHQRTLGTTPLSPTGNCTCVPFYYCDQGQVVSDGSGVIDIRQGRPCLSVLEVCCRNPRATLPPPPATSPSNNSQPGSSTVAPITPGVSRQCGRLHPNGVHARVIGFKDSETQFGEYPWQAAILEQKQIAGQLVFKFVCGATLIWNSVVATAAHCVQGRDASQLVIRLGEWDTQSTSEILPHQDIWGKEIVIHPLYYSGAYYNDIALVFLERTTILSLHIDTICLPFLSPQPSFDLTSCWATGWGKSAFGEGGQYQAVLHEVELPIIPKDICATLLRNTSLGNKFNFHESYLCAGGQLGKDTCIGDGGGPLVCPSLVDPWRYVLAGITSWGIGCGSYGVPGVYADVSQFSAWIEAQISSRVPQFDPREVGVEINGTDNNRTRTATNTTSTSKPRQYI